jgi:DNA-directed RNA polymerase specialized sigma24 family protein
MMANRKKPKGTKSARVAARRAERLRNIGPDASGNYGVNPWATRGHTVEVAPKDIDKILPPHSQFPKRIATQRMIDRYAAHGHIAPEEWRAADLLWQAWFNAGLEARVCAGYDPDAIASGNASTDGLVSARIDGATSMVDLMAAVPARCKGVVRAVVVEDMSAADWAKRWGYGDRASKAHGLARLTQGLRALAQHLGC